MPEVIDENFNKIKEGNDSVPSIEAEEEEQRHRDEEEKEKVKAGIWDNVPTWELTEELKEELMEHDFSISCYEPMRFVVAHKELNQIVHAKIGKENVIDVDEKGATTFEDGKPSTTEMRTLRLDKVIINAIPLSVTKYDNVIHLEYRYKIQFKTNIGKTFTAQINTIEGITQELKDKGLIVVKYEAEEMLTHIVNSMERRKRVIVTNDIENIGYYMVDSKLVGYGVPPHKKPSKERIRQCCYIINGIYDKFKIKAIIPTVLKWSIVAPFSYAKKSINSGANWLPWIHSYGWTNTGKTTSGLIALAVWRLPENIHAVGFGNVDTAARLGFMISQTTYPYLVNEVGLLSDEKRYGGMVEMIKNAVQSPNARGRMEGGGGRGPSKYRNISALSAVMLTGNAQPPNDPAYKRKCLPIRQTPNDQYERKDIESFNQSLGVNKKHLGTLGDFAAYYIMSNPKILGDPWEDIGMKVLSEFYMSANGNGNDKDKKQKIEVPLWIHDLVEHNEITETIDESYLIIRGFIIDTIHKAYERFMMVHKYSDMKYTPELEEQLSICCDGDLIPFIIKEDGWNYIITAAIIHELRKQKIDAEIGGSLKGLAEILRFKYTNKRVMGRGMKVITCSKGDMIGLFGNQVTEDKDLI